jgi:hypothetical protein
VTLAAGAFEILGHRREARHSSTTIRANLQPEPFRQFFDAHPEPLKLKAFDFHD